MRGYTVYCIVESFPERHLEPHSVGCDGVLVRLLRHPLRTSATRLAKIRADLQAAERMESDAVAAANEWALVAVEPIH